MTFNALLHQLPLWDLIVSYQDGWYNDVASIIRHFRAAHYTNFLDFKWYVMGTRLAPHLAIDHIRRFHHIFGPFYKRSHRRGVIRLITCEKEIQTLVLAYAAMYGELDLVQVLLPISAPTTQKLQVVNFDRIEVMDIAAIYGHELIVSMLLKAGFGMTHHGMDGAAEMGHFKVVKLLSEAGMHYSTKTIELATAGGHCDIVSYLLQQGFTSHQPLNCLCGNYTKQVDPIEEEVSTPCCFCAIL